MKLHAERACNVVVACARGEEAAGSVGHEFFVRAAGNDVERFEGAGDVGSFEAEVAVLALREESEEALGFQAAEMNAGGGGSDAGDDGQFGGGAGVAIHQAIEHACAGGFADGGGDFGRGNVGAVGDIHCLMIDEVWVWGKGKDGRREAAQSGECLRAWRAYTEARAPYLSG